MKRILTLASKETGELASLNGKIFYVKINPDTNHAIFVDVLTNAILRETTSVENIRRTNTTIIFSTSSGKTYNLVDVFSLIPSFDGKNDLSPMLERPAMMNDRNFDENEVKELKLDQFKLLFLGCSVVVPALEKDGIITIGDLVNKVKTNFDFIKFFNENIPSQDPKKMNEAVLNILRSVGYSIGTNDKLKFESIGNYFSGNFKAIAKLTSHKGIHYGDGYDKSVFIFDRDINKTEFIQFCKDNNLRLHEAEGWWDDHSMVEGLGNTWIYTWVLAYDD